MKRRFRPSELSNNSIKRSVPIGREHFGLDVDELFESAFVLVGCVFPLIVLQEFFIINIQHQVKLIAFKCFLNQAFCRSVDAVIHSLNLTLSSSVEVAIHLFV